MHDEAIRDGWRAGTTGTQKAIAHYYLNGYSLCHRWITTRMDRDVQQSDERCAYCAGMASGSPGREGSN